MFGLVPYWRNGNGEVQKRRGHGQDDFESLVGEFFGDSFIPGVFKRESTTMRTDIRETDKEYVLEVEIPGMSKENINLDLKNDILTISASYKQEENEEKKDYIRKERSYGCYQRSFRVDKVDNNAVSAKYEDGILTVLLPKLASDTEVTHKINIE